MKRKLVVLAICSSLKRNVFRPSQSSRSTIWILLINYIFDFNVMLQNFWLQPFNALVRPDLAWPGTEIFFIPILNSALLFLGCSITSSIATSHLRVLHRNNTCLKPYKKLFIHSFNALYALKFVIKTDLRIIEIY